MRITTSQALAELGLKPGFNADEIRDAFKRLANQWHPDRSSAIGAQERFQRVCAAYARLSVPADGSDELADYDEATCFMDDAVFVGFDGYALSVFTFAFDDIFGASKRNAMGQACACAACKRMRAQQSAPFLASSWGQEAVPVMNEPEARTTKEKQAERAKWLEEARRQFLQATPMPTVKRSEQRMLVVGVSMCGVHADAAWPEGVVWEAQLRPETSRTWTSLKPDRQTDRGEVRATGLQPGCEYAVRVRLGLSGAFTWSGATDWKPWGHELHTQTALPGTAQQPVGNWADEVSDEEHEAEACAQHEHACSGEDEACEHASGSSGAALPATSTTSSQHDDIPDQDDATLPLRSTPSNLSVHEHTSASAAAGSYGGLTGHTAGASAPPDAEAGSTSWAGEGSDQPGGGEEDYEGYDEEYEEGGEYEDEKGCEEDGCEEGAGREEEEEEAGPSDTRPAQRKGHHHCSVCDVSCHTWAALEKHLHSVPHQRTVRQAREAARQAAAADKGVAEHLQRVAAAAGGARGMYRAQEQGQWQTAGRTQQWRGPAGPEAPYSQGNHGYAQGQGQSQGSQGLSQGRASAGMQGTGPRPPPFPQLVGTKDCRFFLQGHCPRGDRCWFRHDPAAQQQHLQSMGAAPSQPAQGYSATGGQGYRQQGPTLPDPSYTAEQATHPPPAKPASSAAVAQAFPPPVRPATQPMPVQSAAGAAPNGQAARAAAPGMVPLGRPQQTVLSGTAPPPGFLQPSMAAQVDQAQLQKARMAAPAQGSAASIVQQTTSGAAQPASEAVTGQPVANNAPLQPQLQPGMYGAMQPTAPMLHNHQSALPPGFQQLAAMYSSLTPEQAQVVSAALGQMQAGMPAFQQALTMSHGPQVMYVPVPVPVPVPMAHQHVAFVSQGGGSTLAHQDSAGHAGGAHVVAAPMAHSAADAPSVTAQLPIPAAAPLPAPAPAPVQAPTPAAMQAPAAPTPSPSSAEAAPTAAVAASAAAPAPVVATGVPMTYRERYQARLAAQQAAQQLQAQQAEQQAHVAAQVSHAAIQTPAAVQAQTQKPSQAALPAPSCEPVLAQPSMAAKEEAAPRAVAVPVAAPAPAPAPGPAPAPVPAAATPPPAPVAEVPRPMEAPPPVQVSAVPEVGATTAPVSQPISVPTTKPALTLAASQELPQGSAQTAASPPTPAPALMTMHMPAPAPVQPVSKHAGGAHSLSVAAPAFMPPAEQAALCGEAAAPPPQPAAPSAMPRPQQMPRVSYTPSVPAVQPPPPPQPRPSNTVPASSATAQHAPMPQQRPPLMPAPLAMAAATPTQGATTASAAAAPRIGNSWGQASTATAVRTAPTPVSGLAAARPRPAGARPPPGTPAYERWLREEEDRMVARAIQESLRDAAVAALSSGQEFVPPEGMSLGPTYTVVGGSSGTTVRTASEPLQLQHLLATSGPARPQEPLSVSVHDESHFPGLPGSGPSSGGPSRTASMPHALSGLGVVSYASSSGAAGTPLAGHSPTAAHAIAHSFYMPQQPVGGGGFYGYPGMLHQARNADGSGVGALTAAHHSPAVSSPGSDAPNNGAQPRPPQHMSYMQAQHLPLQMQMQMQIQMQQSYVSYPTTSVSAASKRTSVSSMASSDDVTSHNNNKAGGGASFGAAHSAVPAYVGAAAPQATVPNDALSAHAVLPMAAVSTMPAPPPPPAARKFLPTAAPLPQ